MTRIVTRQIPKTFSHLASKDRDSSFMEEALRFHVLARLLDLKRRLEVFEHKYKSSFGVFRKKIHSRRKENFDAWDDFIIWEGLYDAYQLWNRRYKDLM